MKALRLLIILAFSFYPYFSHAMHGQGGAPKPKVKIVLKQISCKKCTQVHHKCDKKAPCNYCKPRGLKCVKNWSTKKRGRPFKTTTQKALKNDTKVVPKKKRERPLGNTKKQKENKKNKKGNAAVNEKTESCEKYLNYDLLSSLIRNKTVNIHDNNYLSNEGFHADNAKSNDNIFYEHPKVNEIFIDPNFKVDYLDNLDKVIHYHGFRSADEDQNFSFVGGLNGSDNQQLFVNEELLKILDNFRFDEFNNF